MFLFTSALWVSENRESFLYSYFLAAFPQNAENWHIKVSVYMTSCEILKLQLLEI